MKITNLRKAIAASLMASGLVCGSTAYAEMINHVVGDPSFDDTPVAASGYSYFNGLPDSAWESDGTWWYNTDYATNTSPKRPDPRTGDQAGHGFGSYNWQALGDTFEAGRTYTLSAYGGGDSDATDPPADGSDRIWLYMYDGTATPASFDADSLAAAFYERDGVVDVFLGGGTGTNAGWTIGGGDEWGLISVSYTATADDDGLPIGVGFFGRGDAALEDVSLTSVPIPEPSTIILCGIGIVGLLVLRQRQLS
jgi:hypothetical protein